MCIDVNYIPYDLLLKGWENCSIREKIVWLWYELLHRLERRK